MKVIVIGAGAAGLMSSVISAEAGNETLLLEKNEKAGKKIYITGKGRCNVTNACDFDMFLSNVMQGGRFMMSSLRAFGSAEMMAFLEKHGCRVKTERGMRVFPVSDHASDVTKALLKAAQEAGVCLKLNCEAAAIRKTDGTFLVDCLVKGVRRQLSADRVIVCTGGLSYPSTGSTGDGYRFAKDFGHTVTKLYPSLVPLLTREDVSSLAGVTLKNVTLTIAEEGKKKPVFSEQGELLFTHQGISGPLALSASAHITDRMDRQRFDAILDLKPALTVQQMDERMLREFETAKNTDITNVLMKFSIGGVRELILSQSGIDPHLKVRDLTKKQRQTLIQKFKELRFEIAGTAAIGEAVITRGGVKLSEIDPKTMESKLVPGLFFAGEVLDIDALTGGFNLQLAWSSAHAAGRSLS